jgi:hypothetical protein
MERQGGKGATPKAIKISALREAFQAEWVAAEVTKVDKTDVSVVGILIIHSPDKNQLYQAVKVYLEQHPATSVYIFFAGDPIPEGGRTWPPLAGSGAAWPMVGYCSFL